MKKFKKLLIATTNPAKVDYYKSVISELAEEIVGLADLGIKTKPEETGNTAKENAQIKARFYSQVSGLPVFSEDAALHVDFLPEDKQPGTHVRRINGKDEVSDEQLLKYWEDLVAQTQKEKRTGYWEIAYCIAISKDNVKTISLNHPIMFFSPSSPMVLPGWPMSSLEGSTRFGKPNSELTEQEKEISKQEVATELKKFLHNLI